MRKIVFCAALLAASSARADFSTLPAASPFSVFSPDSTRMILAVAEPGGAGKTALRDCVVTTGNCGRLPGKPENHTALAYSPDGKWAAAGISVSVGDPVLQLYAANPFKPLRLLKIPLVFSAVRSLSFSGDSRFLAAAFSSPVQNVVAVYDLQKDDAPRVFTCDYGGIGITLQAGPDGHGLIQTLAKDSPADDAGFEVGDELREVDGKDTPTMNEAMDALASGPAGKKVEVKVWRPAKEKFKTISMKRIALPAEVFNTAFSRDGRYLWAFAGNGVRQWNLDTGSLVLLKIVRDRFVSDAAFNPDDRTTLFASRWTKGTVGGHYLELDAHGVRRDAVLSDVVCPAGDVLPYITYRDFFAWTGSRGNVVTASKCGGSFSVVWWAGANFTVSIDSMTVPSLNGIMPSPDGNYLAVFRDTETLVYFSPLFPYRYVIAERADLTSATGKALTTLPKGTLVAVKKHAGSHLYVTVNTTLEGYLPKADLSPVRPDVLKPVIRVMEKTFSPPDLHIRGVAYDDIALESVTVAGGRVEKAFFEVDKGNYTDAFPFDATITINPSVEKTITATDTSGKQTVLPINIEDPVTDYLPAYAQVKTVRPAAVRKTPEAAGEKLLDLRKGTEVAALGNKDGWYYLEGGGWLAQADAREIEVYARPVSEALLVSAGGKEGGTKIVKVESEVDADIPVSGIGNPDAVAVVIGVKDYRNKDVPTAEYAIRDARTVKEYLIKTFGFQEGNILYLENPSKGDFERVFGTRDSYKGEAFNYLKPGKSDLFVYYSGHGAPDAQTKKAYFVPADAHPDYVRLSGYPLDLFYANLAQLPAKSVTVVVDSCFSGASHKGMLLAKASPLVLTHDASAIPERLNVFSSSSGEEMSSWLETKGHSLFTYYFLRGVQEQYGKSGTVSTRQLRTYLGDKVPAEARRLFGRMQTPQFSGQPVQLLEK